MSYQNEPLPKKQYSGSDFIPLSCEKELKEIRAEIEAGENHKGRNFEICYQAIKELFQAQGLNKPNADCSNCTVEWNKLLQNWFKRLDMDIRPKEATSQTEPKELTPIEGGVEKIHIRKIESAEDFKEGYAVDEIEAKGIENNPELSKEDKIAHLQQECREKGIEFRHNAGIKKLTELLNR